MAIDRRLRTYSEDSNTTTSKGHRRSRISDATTTLPHLASGGGGGGVLDGGVGCPVDSCCPLPRHAGVKSVLVARPRQRPCQRRHHTDSESGSTASIISLTPPGGGDNGGLASGSPAVASDSFTSPAHAQSTLTIIRGRCSDGPHIPP